MATENRWRARRIQAELMKLGIRMSLATVSRDLPKSNPGPSQQQRWITFLRNHKDGIAGMDFFGVPTVHFRLLYVCRIYDNDSIFSPAVTQAIHVVVFNEDHLRRLLREYADYDNDEGVHTSIGDAPSGRAVESRPSEHAKVVGLPRVGGLHHSYRWRTAA